MATVQRLVVALVLLTMSSHTAHAQASNNAPAPSDRDQQTDFWRLGNGFAVNPSLILPTSRIFFDSGQDDAGEVDLFRDGKLTVGLQLVGLDMTRAFNENRFRPGVSVGFGITTGEGAAALMISYGALIDISNAFRLEFGRMTGYSASETATGSDDTAWYSGISLHTALGNRLKEALSQ